MVWVILSEDRATEEFSEYAAVLVPGVMRSEALLQIVLCMRVRLARARAPLTNSWR